jgi:hypothetical protein
MLAEMIDRQKRDILAEKLRQLLSGRIDNLLFDDLDDGKFLDSDDEALWEIFHSIWFYYDDFRSHALRLTEGQRLDFIRCVLFLHSDFEFEWPTRRESLQSRFWSLLIRRNDSKPLPAPKGDMAVFPFFRRTDYEEALKKPRLLSGAID